MSGSPESRAQIHPHQRPAIASPTSTFLPAASRTVPPTSLLSSPTPSAGVPIRPATRASAGTHPGCPATTPKFVDGEPQTSLIPCWCSHGGIICPSTWAAAVTVCLPAFFCKLLPAKSVLPAAAYRLPREHSPKPGYCRLSHPVARDTAFADVPKSVASNAETTDLSHHGAFAHVCTGTNQPRFARLRDKHYTPTGHADPKGISPTATVATTSGRLPGRGIFRGPFRNRL